MKEKSKLGGGGDKNATPFLNLKFKIKNLNIKFSINIPLLNFINKKNNF
jgi:hypothetical protein